MFLDPMEPRRTAWRALGTRCRGFPARIAAVLLAIAPSSAAATASVPDSGAYNVFQGTTAIGVERFSFEVIADSLVIGSQSRLLVTPDRADTLVKDAVLVVKGDDMSQYKSREVLRDQQKIRGLLVEDTSMTVFTQSNGAGDATVIIRPPGKIFIVDPLVYTLFDLIGRELHGRTFERRSIQMLVLAGQDSVIEGTATNLGPETIRWGGKPVVTRKIEISDGQLKFTLWMSPAGAMLRLAEPVSGLRVERNPPPVKRRAKPVG